MHEKFVWKNVWLLKSTDHPAIANSNKRDITWMWSILAHGENVHENVCNKKKLWYVTNHIKINESCLKITWKYNLLVSKVKAQASSTTVYWCHHHHHHHCSYLRAPESIMSARWERVVCETERLLFSGEREELCVLVLSSRQSNVPVLAKICFQCEEADGWPH